MKKTAKIALTVLLVVSVTALAVFSAICAFVSWVWGGMRFSPEAAMEAVSIDSSQMEYIQADGCRFYYQTLSDVDTESDLGEMEDCIGNVRPVLKSKLGMWYAVTRPESLPIRAEGDETVIGKLVQTELDGEYHNFIIPFLAGYDRYTEENAFASGYTDITLDGESTELFKHSYFITECEVDDFYIADQRFTIGDQKRGK